MGVRTIRDRLDDRGAQLVAVVDALSARDGGGDLVEEVGSADLQQRRVHHPRGARHGEEGRDADALGDEYLGLGRADGGEGAHRAGDHDAAPYREVGEGALEPAAGLQRRSDRDRVGPVAGGEGEGLRSPVGDDDQPALPGAEVDRASRSERELACTGVGRDDDVEAEGCDAHDVLR